MPGPGAGCLIPGGSALGGAWLGGLLRGVPAPRGVCSGGGAGGDPLGWLLLRAVCILLECILVSFCFDERVVENIP